jgi:hypothetical protein
MRHAGVPTRARSPWQDWWRRRKEFREEWAFHRERASIELSELGLNATEVAEIVERRFGLRSHYGRSVRRDRGADLRGLWELLQDAPLLQAAVRVPLALGLLIALLYAVNPHRAAVWSAVWNDSVREELFNGRGRWHSAPTIMQCTGGETILHGATVCSFSTPWMKPVPVPTGFAKALWFVVFVTGAWRLTSFWSRNRRVWHYWVYGMGTLKLGEILAVSLWATGMQLFDLVPWPERDLREFGLVLSGFLMLFGTVIAVEAWRVDLEKRCPACLKPLRMPLERGFFSSILFNPPEEEWICGEGHGTVTRGTGAATRGTQEFREGGDFWRDLEAVERDSE